MEEADLIAKYPRLWHMAHDGGWPAIRDNGLKSASALLDDYKVTGDRRRQLESMRRPESVPLQAVGLPGAVIRDQKPMSDAKLAACLQDGLTTEDWYELLNSRTFFWLSQLRIWKLLKARAYRNLKQTVLTVDTASIVAAHKKKIWLSSLNSGATLFRAQPRGRGTFSRIKEFPFEARSKSRSLENNVVELLVEEAVPDIEMHVLAVHTVQGDKILNEIWRSPRATDNDHP